MNKSTTLKSLGQGWADLAVTITLWGHGYESVAECVLLSEAFFPLHWIAWYCMYDLDLVVGKFERESISELVIF